MQSGPTFVIVGICEGSGAREGHSLRLLCLHDRKYNH
jgi:hypothetical protein